MTAILGNATNTPRCTLIAPLIDFVDNWYFIILQGLQISKVRFLPYESYR